MYRRRTTRRIGTANSQSLPPRPYGAEPSGESGHATAVVLSTNGAGTLAVAVECDFPTVAGILPTFHGSLRYSHSAIFRAPCRPFSTGCRQCGVFTHGWPFCSLRCQRAFDQDHHWMDARMEALRRASVDGTPICRRCRESCHYESIWAEPNVHHVRPHGCPVNAFPWFGCCHHQSNLHVLCRRCHWIVHENTRERKRLTRRVMRETALHSRLSRLLIKIEVGGRGKEIYESCEVLV